MQPGRGNIFEQPDSKQHATPGAARWWPCSGSGLVPGEQGQLDVVTRERSHGLF